MEATQPEEFAQLVDEYQEEFETPDECHRMAAYHLTQAGDSHPAVWTSSSVNKLSQLLKLKSKTTEVTQLIVDKASSADTTELAPSDPSFVPSFLRTSEAYLTSTRKPSHGLLSSLRHWLRGASRSFS